MSPNLYSAIMATAGEAGAEAGKAEAATHRLQVIIEEIKDYHDNGEIHPKQLLLDALAIAREIKGHTEALSSHFIEYTELIGEMHDRRGEI
jgi:hypothetical protein